ncbi:sigma-70 family RNA polymerase sigma factor [Sporosarcina sp.]|uniref:sigma-70 family RNA polymerase sigma factor n=1 Tax=Sporosarcina sp. TaxID=49982 RepID=UPI002634753A|nr:sigma-70 family RNA polymerase sigma factor [Sporosarcina sp.]
MENSQGESEKWLRNLMDEYGGRLTNLAYSYLKDWGKAQEVVQDVFFTCYSQYAKIEEIQSLEAWTYRITINRCKDVLKSSWIKRVTVNNNLFAFLKSTTVSPEAAVIARDENTMLVKKVLELPVKYREVIHLFYYEELSVAEISALLKININTIKTRLKRGRELLGVNLERGETSVG